MGAKSKRFMALMLVTLLGWTVLGIPTASAAGEVELYTTYRNISVPPGESINYAIDLINQTEETQNVSLTVADAPNGWEYELTAGGWDISQIAVKPEDTRTVYLDVTVPLQVEKGAYTFNVTAVGMDDLPITINVSEKGTYRTELTTEQPNMEGHADDSFSFSVQLRNRTAEEQLYSLRSGAPQGWDVQFKSDFKNVTSVTVAANEEKKVDIEIVPPENVAADTYTIPIAAESGSTSAETQLEVVITGSYDIELTTPTGVLSNEITAGGEKTIDLEVRNTGTAELTDINLSDSSPAGWEVTFEPAAIESLPAGETATVTATVKASDESIAGDYVATFTADTTEVTDSANFRMTVETSMLWGWIGILIILAVIGGIFYLIRKYGRR